MGKIYLQEKIYGNPGEYIICGLDGNLVAGNIDSNIAPTLQIRTSTGAEKPTVVSNIYKNNSDPKSYNVTDLGDNLYECYVTNFGDCTVSTRYKEATVDNGWEDIVLPDRSSGFKDGIFANNMFICLDRDNSGILYISKDGETWHDNIHLPNDDLNWNSISYGNNCFIVICKGSAEEGSNLSAYSIDGLKWNRIYLPGEDRRWTKVIYNKINNYFMAISEEGKFAYTSNINNNLYWIMGSSLPNNSTSMAWTDIALGNQYIVAIDLNSTYIAISLATSVPEKITWADYELRLPVMVNPTKIVCGNYYDFNLLEKLDRFVVLCGDSVIAYSYFDDISPQLKWTTGNVYVKSNDEKPVLLSNYLVDNNYKLSDLKFINNKFILIIDTSYSTTDNNTLILMCDYTELKESSISNDVYMLFEEHIIEEISPEQNSHKYDFIMFGNERYIMSANNIDNHIIISNLSSSSSIKEEIVPITEVKIYDIEL